MRIDKYLAEKYGSRTKAAEAVVKGWALVNGRQVAPSYQLKEEDTIRYCEPTEQFVSNGGYKLSKAIRDFGFDASGKIFADVGASNGGFTDCLFQHGAKKVYCIDVGDSQLDARLKDKNVVIIDHFNARNLNKNLFEEKLDGVVIDVSFISLTYILRAVADILEEGAEVIALIKPQFECESKNVGKNGVVKDAKTHERIIGKIYDYALSCGLTPVGLTNAPLVKDKNYEYLIRLIRGGKYVMPKNILILGVKL